jgi:aminomethyltransferase
MLKRTALYEDHSQAGGKLVEFAGWEMPLYYTSILEEHHAVRTQSGLFDISHMGQIQIRGAGAKSWLNGMVTNDLDRLKPGLAHYTLVCNDQGGVIDDLYIYQAAPETYWLVVNASRFEADLDWMLKHRPADGQGVQIESLRGRYGAIAWQGPKAVDFIDQLVEEVADGGSPKPKPSALKKNELGEFRFAATTMWIARTGYTGEDGFEILAPDGILPTVWKQCLALGQSLVRPVGLGARDTLRTEAGYPLYGHELTEETTPVEAGLSWCVGFDKPVFIGRERLLQQRAGGVSRKAIAFKMKEKCPPPRPGYSLFAPGATGPAIGTVTSGTQSPSLGVGIGLGLVPPALGKTGTQLELEIRGKKYPLEVMSKPIYKK